MHPARSQCHRALDGNESPSDRRAIQSVAPIASIRGLKEVPPPQATKVSRAHPREKWNGRSDEARTSLRLFRADGQSASVSLRRQRRSVSRFYSSSIEYVKRNAD